MRIDLTAEFLREGNALQDETANLCGFHAIRQLQEVAAPPGR